MNHIKNIFDKKIDDWTHKKFIRYSCGLFEKEQFSLKVSGKSVQIQAGFEYLDCVFDIFSRLIKKDVVVKGVIVSNSDIQEDIENFGIDIKKKTGKKYTIDETMDPKKFKDFVQKFNQYYLLLNIKSGDYSLSVKKSIPKPGKLLEKFLTAKFQVTDLDTIKDEFLFDTKVDKFKSVAIKHTYQIDSIEIPKKYENDPNLARLNALRIGKIIREVSVDGKITKSEAKMQV